MMQVLLASLHHLCAQRDRRGMRLSGFPQSWKGHQGDHQNS